MLCKRCQKEIDEDSNYCKYCGRKQIYETRTRTRGNGMGTVYQLPNKKWRAVVTLGYETIDGKKKPVQRTKSDFRTKKEALEYLPQLRTKPKAIVTDIKFKDLYEKWLPTHAASKSTLNCYKAAFKYFEPIHYVKFSEIGIDDLQDCLDECEKGKRTRQNMKAVAGLVYKYAIPRGYQPDRINLAQYVKVGEGEVGTRTEFNAEQIEIISKHVDAVQYADIIYAMIYTGYRPNEFLALELEKYNAEQGYFIGGGKTDAGTNRCVTVSPKIKSIVEKHIVGKTTGAIFTDEDGLPITLEKFREYFYLALEEMNIQNPIVPETNTHTYTPYSCRHTFATLMDKVQGSSKAKLSLMGHTSEEMLRHYQHPDINALREITDFI